MFLITYVILSFLCLRFGIRIVKLIVCLPLLYVKYNQKAVLCQLPWYNEYE